MLLATSEVGSKSLGVTLWILCGYLSGGEINVSTVLEVKSAELRILAEVCEIEANGLTKQQLQCAILEYMITDKSAKTDSGDGEEEVSVESIKKIMKEFLSDKYKTTAKNVVDYKKIGQLIQECDG